jgi:hypothetical protein
METTQQAHREAQGTQTPPPPTSAGVGSGSGAPAKKGPAEQGPPIK